MDAGNMILIEGLLTLAIVAVGLFVTDCVRRL